MSMPERYGWLGDIADDIHGQDARSFAVAASVMVVQATQQSSQGETRFFLDAAASLSMVALALEQTEEAPREAPVATTVPEPSRLTVACPECSAPVGSPCRTTLVGIVMRNPHPARLKAAAEHCVCGGYWRGAVEGPYAVCASCGARKDPAHE